MTQYCPTRTAMRKLVLTAGMALSAVLPPGHAGAAATLRLQLAPCQPGLYSPTYIKTRICPSCIATDASTDITLCSYQFHPPTLSYASATGSRYCTAAISYMMPGTDEARTASGIDMAHSGTIRLEIRYVVGTNTMQTSLLASTQVAYLHTRMLCHVRY